MGIPFGLNVSLSDSFHFLCREEIRLGSIADKTTGNAVIRGIAKAVVLSVYGHVGSLYFKLMAIDSHELRLNPTIEAGAVSERMELLRRKIHQKVPILSSPPKSLVLPV